MAGQGNVQELMEQSDRCSKEKKWKEGAELLSSYHETDNPQLLWRIVRDQYRLSKHYSKDAVEAEELARNGLELAKKALALDSTSYLCYKWIGIILSHHSGLVGQKEKIASAVQVREYFEKAIELNPNDMASKHVLGRWHYNVASVPWYVRSAAKLVYGTPPTSTFEEALNYFEAAEKLNKLEFVGNWLYLAKTYYQLGNKVQAKKWASEVCQFKGPISPDIVEAKTECEHLLGKL